MKPSVIRYGLVFLVCLGTTFVVLLLYLIEYFDGPISTVLSVIIWAYYLIYAVLVSVLKWLVKKDWYAVFIALGMTLIIAGFQFKIQHWPAAQILMISGIAIASLSATAFALRKLKF